MARIVLIGVALIGFCLLPALQASAQQPAEQAPIVPSKDDPSYQLGLKQAEANAELDAVAKELAALLSEPGFRGLVKSTIAQSKKRENIVELEDFLAQAAKKTDLPPGVKKLNDDALKAKGRIRDLKVWNREGFDLYFPVKDHVNKWKGDTDFYVAYSPYNRESDVGEIYGYSVKTGELYAFGSAAAPDVPVLIVAPCEHETHEIMEAEAAEKAPAPLTKTQPDNKPRKVEGGKGGNSNYKFDWMWIWGPKDFYEAWYHGAMEIYFWYADVNTSARQQHASLSKATYFVAPTGATRTSWIEISTPVYCSLVVDVDRWYSVNRAHVLSSTCSPYSVWNFIERDGGTMAATEYGGTVTRYSINQISYQVGGAWGVTNVVMPFYDGDSWVGQFFINRGNYQYSNDYFVGSTNNYCSIGFRLDP
jgi:hypothetical protein